MMNNPWFMSLATKEFYRSEFVKEMRGSLKDGHFTLLPSEAAKIVGDRWSVSPETVLLSLAPL